MRSHERLVVCINQQLPGEKQRAYRSFALLDLCERKPHGVSSKGSVMPKAFNIMTSSSHAMTSSCHWPVGWKHSKPDPLVVIQQLICLADEARLLIVRTDRWNPIKCFGEISKHWWPLDGFNPRHLATSRHVYSLWKKGYIMRRAVTIPGLILGLRPASERRCYFETLLSTWWRHQMETFSA